MGSTHEQRHGPTDLYLDYGGKRDDELEVKSPARGGRSATLCPALRILSNDYDQYVFAFDSILR